MLKKVDLRKYQSQLAKEIINRLRILLAVDMGLGKTVSCLTAVQEMPEVKKVLIVAPLRVAHATWPDEFEKWEHLKDETFTVIKGDAKQRMKCLEEDTRFYIINRENIVWLYENCSIDFDMIIWDESSSLKAAKAKTKTGKLSRFGALLKFVQKIKRVVLLTGTPTPNGLKDIYGQIVVLDNGARLGKSKNKFLEEYFINRSRVHTYQIWEARASSYDTVMNKCADLIIKMKSEDYITLPDFISIDVKVEMDTKEMKLYNDLKEHFVLKDADIVAVNPAILTNKLLQICTGSCYREDGTYRTFHTLKIEALRELIEENEDENFLVFYNYQHEKEQLVKAFPDTVILSEEESQSTIKKWNQRKIKIMACHPASAGHGLNFQEGGSIMVWLSLPWSLELYQQANKRLHRSGQKDAVRCYHILAKKTVELKVLQALQDKDATQEKIFKLIRDLN